MLTINLNEDTRVIEVQSNDQTNSTIIARGHFAVDKPGRTTLIIFNIIQITPDNHQKLNQLLSQTAAHVGLTYRSLVCIRLPAIFDGRFDFEQLKCQNNLSPMMSVTLDHLKYYPEKKLSEDYELVTEKDAILNSTEQILPMMHRDAFWAKDWNFQGIKDRTQSATHVVMITDRVKNTPCGFGRISLLKTNDEFLGYLSDIAIDSAHQSKGLGSILVNELVSICVSQEVKQKGMTGTLCLQYAIRGSGAISAPKLYRKFGFADMEKLENRIAIFANADHYG